MLTVHLHLVAGRDGILVVVPPLPAPEDTVAAAAPASTTAAAQQAGPGLGGGLGGGGGGAHRGPDIPAARGALAEAGEEAGHLGEHATGFEQSKRTEDNNNNLEINQKGTESHTASIA